MTWFLLSLAAFVVAHLVPSAPGMRRRMIERWGRGPYLAVYSVVSLALLALVIATARAADDVTLWDPAPWQWRVPFLVMPVAAFLLVAGLVEANPLSISLRAGESLPAVAAVTRHPLPWAFLLWALAHIPPNGRVVPVLLFGAMALLALAGFPLLDRKARARLGQERWRTLVAARPGGAVVARLLGSAALALALYAWFVMQGHAWLIGPDPLAGLIAFG